MPGVPSANYGMYIGTVGGDTGAWGGDVNANLTTFLDSFLGNTLGKSITVADVTLTISEWQNAGIFKLTGVLTGNRNLILPFNGSTGAGTAVGGKFIVDNQCTGNFTVTVKTVAAGSVGVVAPPGARTSMYSDQTNVLYADDSRLAKLVVVAGNPNGSVTGNAGNPATGQGTDIIWDVTDQLLFVSAGSGGGAGTSGTVWNSIGQNLPTPQGYLTPTSGVPIIPGDVAGATSIFYTPYKGNLIPIYGGTQFATFSFAELPLALSAGSQLASSIYDVFVFLNAGVVTIAFGPPWTSGSTGGSVTPGSCARGQGALSSQLTRINGILVNLASIPAANNGGSTFVIGANLGTYVGSLFVDATNGQASFTRTWGGNGAGGLRKWALWNAYNRVPIILQGGDGTASWTYAGSGVWRQSNAAVANQLQLFSGLSEEEAAIDFRQTVNASTNGCQIGIGMNSTTVPSGYTYLTNNSSGAGPSLSSAVFINPPFLGVNNANMIELGSPGAALSTFKGTNANMVMTARYMG